MATITSLIHKLVRFDPVALAVDVLRDHSTDLVDLQRDQLLHGERSDGENIHPLYRSPAYATYKAESGSLAPYRVPDLKDTGAFYSGIHVAVDSDGVAFTSTDEKTADLIDKYTPEIFGLNQERKKKAVYEWLQRDYLRGFRMYLAK